MAGLLASWVSCKQLYNCMSGVLPPVFTNLCAMPISITAFLLYLLLIGSTRVQSSQIHIISPTCTDSTFLWVGCLRKLVLYNSNPGDFKNNSRSIRSNKVPVMLERPCRPCVLLLMGVSAVLLWRIVYNLTGVCRYIINYHFYFITRSIL